MLSKVTSDRGEQSFEIGNGVSGSLLFETAPDEQCPLKRGSMIDALLIETLGFNDSADIRAGARNDIGRKGWYLFCHSDALLCDSRKRNSLIVSAVL